MVRIGLDASTLEVAVNTTTALIRCMNDVWDPGDLYHPGEVILNQSLKAVPITSFYVVTSIRAVKAFKFYD